VRSRTLTMRHLLLVVVSCHLCIASANNYVLEGYHRRDDDNSTAVITHAKMCEASSIADPLRDYLNDQETAIPVEIARNLTV